MRLQWRQNKQYSRGKLRLSGMSTRCQSSAPSSASKSKSNKHKQSKPTSPSDHAPTGSESKNGVEAHVYEVNEAWRRFHWSEPEVAPPTPRQAYERLADAEAKVVQFQHRWGKLERHHASLSPLRMRQHRQIARPMNVDVALPQLHPRAESMNDETNDDNGLSVGDTESLNQDNETPPPAAAAAAAAASSSSSSSSSSSESGSSDASADEETEDDAIAELEAHFDHENKGWPCVIALPSEAGPGSTFGDGLDELVQSGVIDLSGGCICAGIITNMDSWFVDGPWVQHESYITQVVVDHLRRNFNATTFHLVGMQQAGWAAVSLLMRFPHLFATATAYDAPLLQEKVDWVTPGLRDTVASDLNMSKLALQGNATDAYIAQCLNLTESASYACSDCGRITLLSGPNFPQQSVHFSNLLAQMNIKHRLETSTAPFDDKWYVGWMNMALPHFVQTLHHHHIMEGKVRHDERLDGDGLDDREEELGVAANVNFGEELPLGTIVADANDEDLFLDEDSDTEEDGEEEEEDASTTESSHLEDIPSFFETGDIDALDDDDNTSTEDKAGF